MSRKKAVPKKDNPWEWTFMLCVVALFWGVKKLNPIFPGGMDYFKINVILFCILLPIILAVSIGLNVLCLIGVL